jgi:hypothetical protein
MNKMYYEYLKNHAYVSYNKKSTYDFELSKERAECMANKYNSSTCELQKENQELKKQLHDASIQIQELIEKDIWCPSNCEKLEQLQKQNKKQKKVIDKINHILNNQINYREFVDIVNAIEDVVEEVSE